MGTHTAARQAAASLDRLWRNSSLLTVSRWWQAATGERVKGRGPGRAWGCAMGSRVCLGCGGFEISSIYPFKHVLSTCCVLGTLQGSV